MLFEWETGVEPLENDAPVFEILGEATARMHAHSASWRRPAWFERHTWDFETSLGDRPHWGSWRDGVGMKPDKERLFAHTVKAIRHRLGRFGKGPNRFGLIHGDMRLANLLVDGATDSFVSGVGTGVSRLLSLRSGAELKWRAAGEAA